MSHSRLEFSQQLIVINKGARFNKYQNGTHTDPNLNG